MATCGERLIIVVGVSANWLDQPMAFRCLSRNPSKMSRATPTQAPHCLTPIVVTLAYPTIMLSGQIMPCSLFNLILTEH